MKGLLRLAFIAVLAVSAGATACSKCGGANGAEDASTMAEPPVPAPERMIADLVFASPNATWNRLQKNIGGAIGILPAGAGGILCSVFDVDPALGPEIDGGSPAFGVLAGDPASPSWAVALKLVELRRARGVLVDGDVARFTPKEAVGYTELVPKVEARQPGAALALTKSGYLIIARHRDELAGLVPYVSRTLPTREIPKSGAVIEMPKSAIANVIAPRLEQGWSDFRAYLLSQDENARKAHGGRAPDYGDPKAIVAGLDVAAKSKIDLVKDVERVKMTFDVDENGAFLDTSLFPSTGGGPASKWIDGMTVGGPEAVLSMPATSAVALSMRDKGTGELSDAGAAEIEQSLVSAFGGKLTAADAKKVRELGEDFTKARGDTLGAAMSWDEPRGLFFRGAVKDNEAATRAVRASVELLKIPAVLSTLHAREVRVAPAEATPLEKVELATFVPEVRDGGRPLPPMMKDAGAPPAFGVAWAMEGAALDVSAGTEPLVTLRNTARPDHALTDEPTVVRPLGALGKTASAILVVQPLRFDPRRANLPTAPIVVALGKREKDGYVRIDIATGVLRELTRFAMGM